MKATRRNFLIRSVQGGAGLSLAVMLPGCGDSQGPDSQPVASAPPADPFVANAFVTIDPDSTVTVQIKHLEMGQGPMTGLATLVAEELDADWEQIVAVASPVGPEYFHTQFGMQMTGGSSAISNSYQQMREAGAAARHMLVAAAAANWGVPASEITVKRGVVMHEASGQQARFGELAGLAARQPVPSSVTLKSPDQFTLIGRSLSRKDEGKTDGSALFTQDVQMPGMLTAVVAHAPRYGATVARFDATAAREVAGVAAVLQIESGVAVLANTFWQAKTARDLLEIEWNEDTAFLRSSEELFEHYRSFRDQPGDVFVSEGDVGAAFGSAEQVIEATYEVPFLAHAAMEPMNCVIRFDGQKAELWYGCQAPTFDQMALAPVLGIEQENIVIHTLYAGGSFGRRANAHSDYVVEAARIAKSYGQDVPIKLVWTREDDTRSGYFRPMYVHHLKGALDQSGNIIAWQHRIIGQSISKGTVFEAMVQNGVDPQTVEGAHIPYTIPNLQIESHTIDLPVPVLWWRSVASTHNAYVTEAFVDELAQAAGRDALEFRLGMLGDKPRHAEVLRLAAEKAGWGGALPRGKGRGLALHRSFGTFVAQVADVTVAKDGSYSVDRVNCAVDCGVAVNPDIIAAQMEGGIGFGLSPAMMSEITFENGAMVQQSFDAYEVLRIDRMPHIEVHIVPSVEPPTGVGEPGTPVIAPAVVNALTSVTGLPYRRLPIGTTLQSA